MSGGAEAGLQAAGVWTAVHLLLLVVLSMLVVRQRRKHRVGVGDDGVPGLAQAMRAFGNAAEYIPPALVGLVLLALLDFDARMIHGLGAAFFAGRIAHAIGLSGSTGVSPGRSVGMALTWLVYLLLAGALLSCAL